MTEALERLSATLHPEPTDTIFRMSAPIVYDRIIGDIKQTQFQARLYAGQVSPDSVIAQGDLQPSETGTLVHVEFVWGAVGPRALVRASGVIGLLLLPTVLAAWQGLLFCGPFLFYWAYKTAMASYERRCICEVLANGLLPNRA